MNNQPEGKYVIEFCPERKMNRTEIKIVASNMGIPTTKIMSDSRYYVRRWMSENIPFTNIKNYRLCRVRHFIGDKCCYDKNFDNLK